MLRFCRVTHLQVNHHYHHNPLVSHIIHIIVMVVSIKEEFPWSPSAWLPYMPYMVNILTFLISMIILIIIFQGVWLSRKVPLSASSARHLDFPFLRFEYTHIYSDDDDDYDDDNYVFSYFSPHIISFIPHNSPSGTFDPMPIQ